MPAFQSLSKYLKICIFSPDGTMVLNKVHLLWFRYMFKYFVFGYCYVFLHIVVCTVHSHHWFDAIQMFTRQSIKLWKCLLSWFCSYVNALFSFPSVVCILLPFRILCMACKNFHHCENRRMCLNLNFVIWMLNKMICIFQNCLHQQTAIRTHMHMLLNL